MNLLGWDITIRRVHAASDCPVCIMKTLREACHERIGDCYMPRHSQVKPYGLVFAQHCQLGFGCRCLLQAEALKGRFAP